MKKLLAFAFLGMVSCALVTTPAQASSAAKPGLTLVKHKHKHKHHKHHHKVA